MNELIAPELLRKLLRYEPETGKLFWLYRSREMFKKEQPFKSWNTRFCGKEALTSRNANGYMHGHVTSTKVLCHRVIWALVHNAWPNGEIDHINGIRDDNRIANLRVVTVSINQRNAKLKSHNTSGHVGVCRDESRDKWIASICVNGKRKTLGRFDKIEDAIKARKHGQSGLGFTDRHGKIDDMSGGAMQDRMWTLTPLGYRALKEANE